MKKILIPAILMATCLLGASACSSNRDTMTTSVTSVAKEESSTVTESVASVIAEESSAAEYRKITAEEAKAMIDAGNVIILDVRTISEYNAGHIAESIQLESGDFETKAAAYLPDKNATMLVYCRSGNRSKTAAMLLLDLGYTNVYDFGGIIDWPYETVK